MEVEGVLQALVSESLRRAADEVLAASQKAEARHEEKSGKKSSSHALPQPSVLQPALG